MTFEQYQYTRPNIEETKSNILKIEQEIKNAKTANEVLEVFTKYNTLRNSLETMSVLVEIRHTIDTTEKFYESEREFWDEFSPELTALKTKVDTAIFNSPFKTELKKEIGEHYFNLIETNLKVFNDDIIEDLKEENKLASEYTKLTSSAKIPFDGKERNLSGMAKYTQHEDRNVRLEAGRAVAKFFTDNLEQYDSIYDRMVKVRTRIAKKLGFENFVEVAYLRLNRTDYNAKDVANYRKQILEEVVPLVEELKKAQAKRLGLEALRFQDEAVNFKSGNPTPKGDRAYLVESAKTMYKELSPETDEFFSFMVNNNLLDLDTKPGKTGGGYCTFLPDYKAPFIFANFNGTPHDAEVLTHEAGHAFQVYQSKNHLPEYVWPTFEACEIHSMSMEFLTWPWMELFFKEETEKFKYYHLTGSLKFLPYGVTVDEFQHAVYENPEMSPKERRAKWIEIEKKYLPSRDYTDIPELNNGMFFYRQLHLFQMPFYYIDYTLAQVCAFQFWKKARDNREKAWEEYLHLCRLGGTLPFLALVKEANLENPFQDGTISHIVPEIKKYIDSVNAEQF
ncbi:MULTISPECIES: M3 family oligoendopeptidase [Gemella]|uniref:M3 family oligoendopeptidase n=1 Tax=Gemella TaxID=1378 RepID=UPI00076818A1|nr:MULTISPECIES: M3 family oligoendopeptidase [Gemella]AME09041.1 peptidase [Gemella sp. oral taxon 928]AXI26614.1 M3 family oligoendopeptidase [Gemella sp. ND 6198]